jgi:hypothetical protein
MPLCTPYPRGENVNRVAEVWNRRTSKAMILVGRARKTGPSRY